MVEQAEPRTQRTQEHDQSRRQQEGCSKTKDGDKFHRVILTGSARRLIRSKSLSCAGIARNI
jgi:hypothetical protein